MPNCLVKTILCDVQAANGGKAQEWHHINDLYRIGWRLPHLRAESEKEREKGDRVERKIERERGMGR